MDGVEAGRGTGILPFFTAVAGSKLRRSVVDVVAGAEAAAFERMIEVKPVPDLTRCAHRESANEFITSRGRMRGERVRKRETPETYLVNGGGT